MDVVLRLLEEIDLRGVRKVGQEGEGQDSQGSLRDHPRRDLDAAPMADDEIVMVVLRPLYGLDLLDVRDGRLEVGSPLHQPILLFGLRLEVSDHPGKVRTVVQEAARKPGRARPTD